MIKFNGLYTQIQMGTAQNEEDRLQPASICERLSPLSSTISLFSLVDRFRVLPWAVERRFRREGNDSSCIVLCALGVYLAAGETMASIFQRPEVDDFFFFFDFFFYDAECYYSLPYYACLRQI